MFGVILSLLFGLAIKENNKKMSLKFANKL